MTELRVEPAEVDYLAAATRSLAASLRAGLPPAIPGGAGDPGVDAAYAEFIDAIRHQTTEIFHGLEKLGDQLGAAASAYSTTEHGVGSAALGSIASVRLSSS